MTHHQKDCNDSGIKFKLIIVKVPSKIEDIIKSFNDPKQIVLKTEIQTTEEFESIHFDNENKNLIM